MPSGMRPPNVTQELRLAWEEQRPILPLRLAAVTFPDEMRYMLAGRQSVDAVDRAEEAWFPDLCRALAGQCAAGEALSPEDALDLGLAVTAALVQLLAGQSNGPTEGTSSISA